MNSIELQLLADLQRLICQAKREGIEVESAGEDNRDLWLLDFEDGTRLTIQVDRRRTQSR